MSKTFLIFSAQYLPTSGGVERFSYNLAQKLISHGNRVILVTSSLKNLPSHEADADGIEIFRFPSWPLMNGRLPLLRPGKSFRELEQCLWSNSIDYCLINTYFYPLSMYAAFECHRRRIPALVLNHGSAWLLTGNPIAELAGKLYEHLTAKICYRYCRTFYGVSKAACQWLNTFSIQAKGVITNAIDPGEVCAAVNPAVHWAEQLSLPEGAAIIAFVGRMIPEKGVIPLIEAMKEIRKVHPTAYLLMAGDGPLLNQCQLSAHDGVFFLGNLPYSDVLALLSQASLFCLPSRSEGFACTVLEAAALGCPILTTATGGSPQLLIDAAHGTLLSDMSPNTIAQACIHALSDANWRKKASQLAHKQLIENFTWDASIQQLYEAFSIHPQ